MAARWIEQSVNNNNEDELEIKHTKSEKRKLIQGIQTSRNQQCTGGGETMIFEDRGSVRILYFFKR